MDITGGQLLDLYGPLGLIIVGQAMAIVVLWRKNTENEKELKHLLESYYDHVQELSALHNTLQQTVQRVIDTIQIKESIEEAVRDILNEKKE